MRYLTENNEYAILYSEHMSMSILKNKPVPVKEAWVLDKNKNEFILSDMEHWKGDLEKCLMKLGKRLIRRWQNLKK